MGGLPIQVVVGAAGLSQARLGEDGTIPLMCTWYIESDLYLVQ
jgi:hypothetical protein